MQRIALVSTDLQLHERLSSALERDAKVDRLLATSTELTQEIGRLQPSLLLIDVGSARPDTLVRQMVEAAAASNAKPEVVTLGNAANANHVIQALRAGSVDFVDRAETSRNMRDQIVQRLRETATAPRTDGPLSVVIGAKAGGGASLFAVNLGLVRTTVSGEGLLIECNLPAGDADVALDLKPNYSLVDAVRDQDRLDRTLLTAALSTHSSGLRLLPLSLRGGQDATLSPESFLRVLRTVRPMFRETVLVISGLPHPQILNAVLEASSRAYLFCPQAFTAVRDAKDLLNTLSPELDLARRLTLVIDEYSPQITLSDDQMRAALGLDRSVKMPRVRDDLLNSLNLGRPLVLEKPAGAYAETLRMLAYGDETQMASAAAPARPLSGVRNLLNVFGGHR